MLTKGDLAAIKTIVQDEVKIIVKKEVKVIVKTEVGELRTEMNKLRTEIMVGMNENTKDLVELITTGFSTHESLLDNHETRIVHLEFNKM
ncbi:hypothetical protein COZ40_01615 [Candidatus Roizmanbacteria bacterium CG_4_10_14_3_um_filter_39_13]|uniref:Uncharacterized protein n=2 Tax=Microgenomates group TaxID=1794810 RepID=A0A2H0DUT6_9BACT|nr:MAG: hypothetical protein COW83_02230 [Candidatus Collierbacteria bacterium CG22_combo_CG10-13_8_21_14_all_43_12]PIX68756.1 MAG: hypothetical protein COZ40_01615 [Candidatus Roizmanbacteria bacterium CG_4_10_14_3_um_filter_39_13]